MKRQPRKKKVEDNSLNRKVIEELSEELGISKQKIKHATQHFFGWQREAFDNVDYESYLWRYFGTFKVIPKRYEEHIKKQTNKTINKTNKIDNNNGKIEEKSPNEN